MTAFNTVVNDPNLDYFQVFGSYTEITFNPVGPFFNDGRFNPLHNMKIGKRPTSSLTATTSRRKSTAAWLYRSTPC